VERNLRRLVDRCTERRVVLTDDDIACFLRLHELTMDRHGTAFYLPKPAFQRRFQQRIRVVSAACSTLACRMDSRLQLNLSCSGRTPWASAGMDPTHRQLSASAFLHWRVFERLACLGYAANDLTDAALNAVTHFKSQLGGALVLNPVIETAGSATWQAGNAVERLYRHARGGPGLVVHRRRRQGGR
jgi:hypothetical protein